MAVTDVLIVSLLPASHRNISCLTLQAALFSQGIASDLLYVPSESAFDEAAFRRFIAERSYRVVGLSVMTESFGFACRITEQLKRLPDPPLVVWGGIHPTLMPEECVEHADCACVGEGDRSFPEFIRRVRAGEDCTTIPGMAFRLDNGEFMATGRPQLIDDLDALPFNRYDFDCSYVLDGQGLRSFGSAEYVAYSNYHGQDYTLMATRSCPFSCSYCCNSYLNALNGGARVRKRSVEHVISEIHHALTTLDDIRFINFIDDQFLTSRKWSSEFVKRYKDEINLPFIVRLVPGTFNDKEVGLMADAGLSVAQVGIQSGSERTNTELYSRKFDYQRIVLSSKILSRAGVHPIYDVIIHNPLETDEDRERTVALVADLEKPFSLNLFALTPFPKTRIASLYRERGILSPTDPYGEGYRGVDKDDFFYQILSVAPYTDRKTIHHYLSNRNDLQARRQLAAYYTMSSDKRRGFVIQDRLRPCPKTS